MAEKETASETRGTGTDTLDGDGRVVDAPSTRDGRDPNANRKAIISKYNAVHQADMEIDVRDTPGATDLQGGYVERGNATTTDGDAGAESATQAPRGIAETSASGVDSARTGGQDEMVTLKVYGRQIQEPRSVVEAAGGVAARQIQLAAEHKLQQGEELLAQAEDNARRAEELQQVAADKRRAFNERLKELNGNSATPSRPTVAPAAQVATDSTARQPARTGTTVPATGPVDMEDLKEVVLELYSGDPARGAAALADVMMRAQAQPTVDVNKLIALEQARFDKEWAEREATAARKVQIDAVNTLMSSKYKDVLADPQLRADCAHLYNAEVADSRNRGRPWVVIADEVAMRVLGRAGREVPPNSDVGAEVGKRTNFKRRIPAPSSATERVPEVEAQPDYPTSPSDVVNMLRAARHQPLI
jgi:hypothetical protein